jgi:hypothetical protein
MEGHMAIFCCSLFCLIIVMFIAFIKSPNKVKKSSIKEKREFKYFLLTIQRPGEPIETMPVYVYSPSRFLAIENELGRKTVILYSVEMNEEDYNEWISVRNLMLKKNLNETLDRIEMRREINKKVGN